MAHLIDKDALVAEIESYKSAAEWMLKGKTDLEHWSSQKGVCDKLLYFIDSMKENPKTDWLQELKEKLDSLSKEDFKKVMAKYSRYGEEGSVNYGKLNTMLDELLSKETKDSWNERLDKDEEPVSEDLEKAIDSFLATYFGSEKEKQEWPFLKKMAIHFAEWQKEKEYTCYEEAFEDGAKWKVDNLWKPADGDDLPEIDREVIALLGNGKVVFAHRPPEYWDGKNIGTGEVTRYYPKTYGKGGWNIPDIKWWLDVELPKEIEL